MANIANPVGWFEIPVLDMNRAILFYNKVFGYDLKSMELGPTKMAWFPANHEKTGAMGTLIQSEGNYEPSGHAGVLIYFSCEDVATTLTLVAEAGGKIIQEKKQISPDHGYMGLLMDSEGNRIAVHSNQ